MKKFFSKLSGCGAHRTGGNKLRIALRAVTLRGFRFKVQGCVKTLNFELAARPLNFELTINFKL